MEIKTSDSENGYAVYIPSLNMYWEGPKNRMKINGGGRYPPARLRTDDLIERFFNRTPRFFQKSVAEELFRRYSVERFRGSDLPEAVLVSAEVKITRTIIECDLSNDFMLARIENACGKMVGDAFRSLPHGNWRKYQYAIKRKGSSFDVVKHIPGLHNQGSISLVADEDTLMMLRIALDNSNIVKQYDLREFIE